MRALMGSSLLFVVTGFLHANGSTLSRVLALRSKRDSIPGYRRCKRRHVALGALVEDLLTLDHVEYGLRDIGGVIADPLNVLGAEHQMDAEGDVARIFHHIGQQLAEQRGADGVDFLVALP